MKAVRTSLACTAAAIVLAACSGGGGGGAGEERMVADLDLDIRQSAHVQIRVKGGDVSASITLGDGMGVAPTGVPIEGRGKREEFPEAGVVLYTAKLASVPVADGPCGASPVSLAFTLHRTGESAHVGGGIAAYCGAGTYSGTPVRMLRLSGLLPRSMSASGSP